MVINLTLYYIQIIVINNKLNLTYNYLKSLLTKF